MKLRHAFIGVLFLAFGGCAGWGRGCSSWQAENFGSDWVVAQFDQKGEPFNCWKLTDTSITNEKGSDGIYWKSPDDHLVHISGWYNRVQVNRSDFAGAAKQVGVDITACKEGKYVKEPEKLDAGVK